MLGDMRIRPDAAAGYAACQAACAAAPHQRPAEGSVGAGAGALVGKIFGFDRAMQGGIGTASFTVHGVTVGALIACNAVGDVYHPRSRQLLAGCRSSDGRQLLGARDALLQGHAPQSLLAGSNTTIGVVATDMALTKAQAQRLATVGHDGLARAINPVLDSEDPIPQEYTLEVSSPGINRKLTRPEHFEAFLEAPVRVKLIRPLENGVRELEGILIDVAENGDFEVITEEDTTVTFTRKECASVNLIEDYD